jgi:predicted nuclease of predicted toxin-antitoxin system
MIRFLADEGCNFRVVLALRAQGFDVLSVAESRRGVSDQVVLRIAQQESRILITEDKDFGQLFFADARHSLGVILLRYPHSVRSKMSEDVLRLVRERQAQLLTHFFVLQPGRMRVSGGEPK